ncbi:hypothetical protein GGR56DRAFT_629181 [Xylariaceae sp. FL0804]|nr:hypothetical protein GGR56DRAFT_629181 [Xylariaceae sp. FL0804]
MHVSTPTSISTAWCFRMKRCPVTIIYDHGDGHTYIYLSALRANVPVQGAGHASRHCCFLGLFAISLQTRFELSPTGDSHAWEARIGHPSKRGLSSLFTMGQATNAGTIVGALMALLSILAVSARFYARHIRKSGLSWDDWLILVSLLTTIATDILGICAITGDPTGPAAATVMSETDQYTPADVLYTQLSWATTLVYFTITSTTKLSILFLYSRLFSVDQTFRRMIDILSVLVIAFWIGCTVANLLNCIPFKYTWINSQDNPRFCFNYNVYWFASAICEAFLDILIILLPIKVISGLQFTTKQKVAVASVFMLGIFVIASGLLKAFFGYIPGSREPDFSRTQLWTTVHCGVGIVCACLPVCWPLFTRLGKARPYTWPGISSLWRYWHGLSSWRSVEQPSHSHHRSSSEARFEMVSNNFTSRGFGVSFSRFGREQHEEHDEYFAPSVPHSKGSVAAASVV